MLRILFFIIVVFAIGLGFAWLADRPGEMVVTFNGYQYQVTLMVAAVILVALVAAIMIVWWLVKGIWNSPHTISRYFRVRRRDRGYQALSTGMIAAGAGDAILARKKKKEAMKLISADQEPLIHLLDAQASLLEGDHESARQKFVAMLDDPETRLLGLRGLYLEAERSGQREAARHYAAQAAGAAPQLAWAAEATLEERAEQGDWDGALRLVEAQRATKQVAREAVTRRRAVLLTAKAMSVSDADPTAARNAATEALRLAPDFVPAALAAARAHFRLDDLRKGAKILESAWKKDAHPQIAELYVNARPGDSVIDRLSRAKRLQTLRNNNGVSSLAVARAALQAGEYRLAREEAEAAIRIEPREGAFLLMADIEEADGGDEGKVRQWLAKALRAPRDAAWVADGYVSEKWVPFSPVTGRIDAFEWRVPVERVAQLIEDRDIAEKQAGSNPVQLPQPEKQRPFEPRPDIVDVEAAAELSPVAPPAPVESKAPAAELSSAEDTSAATPSNAIEQPSAVKAVEPLSVAPTNSSPVERESKGPARPAAEIVNFVRPPDDPGVDEGEEQAREPGRFKLF